MSNLHTHNVWPQFTYRKASLHKEYKGGGEQQIECVESSIRLLDGAKGGFDAIKGSARSSFDSGVFESCIAKDFVVKL